MSIVMYLGGNVKEYEEKSPEIMARAISEGRIKCDNCLRAMKRHSSYTRGIKETGEKIEITMVQCRNCAQWEALLPDFLLPHKHYSGNEVEGVIIDSETLPVYEIETEASPATVRRWIEQIGERIVAAVGKLKHAFGRARRSVSEIAITPGHCYSELEEILEKAPEEARCSGNKLGLANMWMRTCGVAAYI